MPVQIIGFTSANIAEVDANTKALRASLRPEDYGARGAFSLAGASGLMSAGLAGGSDIASFRWGATAPASALIKRIRFSMGASATGFAAGVAIFKLFRATSFSISPSSGTSLLPSAAENRLKSSAAATLLTAFNISSTGALTTGTRTLDTNPMGVVVAGVPVTAGQNIVPPTDLFLAPPGEFPLMLQNNEGFVLQATVPITGTWSFGISVQWIEFADASYPG